MVGIISTFLANDRIGLGLRPRLSLLVTLVITVFL